MKRRALVYVNIAVILFGLAGLFAKWIDKPAVAITFGRVFFSSIALGIYLKLRKQRIMISDKKDIVMLICAGVILAVHWWSFLESIKISTVAIGTVTFSAFPLFVTFIEPKVYQKKIRKEDIMTAVFILIGVLITVPEFSFKNNMFSGILTGLLSALTYAVLTVMNKGFSGKYSGTLTAFYEQSTAAIVLLPLILKSGFSPSHKDLALLLLLGIATTAFAHTLFISALKDIPAQLAGIFSSMETVYGIVLALILLKEVPSVREIAGGIIIVGTVILAQILNARRDTQIESYRDLKED